MYPGRPEGCGLFFLLATRKENCENEQEEETTAALKSW